MGRIQFANSSRCFCSIICKITTIRFISETVACCYRHNLFIVFLARNYIAFSDFCNIYQTLFALYNILINIASGEDFFNVESNAAIFWDRSSKDAIVLIFYRCRNIWSKQCIFVSHGEFFTSNTSYRNAIEQRYLTILRQVDSAFFIWESESCKLIFSKTGSFFLIDICNQEFVNAGDAVFAFYSDGQGVFRVYNPLDTIPSKC